MLNVRFFFYFTVPPTLKNRLETGLSTNKSNVCGLMLFEKSTCPYKSNLICKNENSSVLNLIRKDENPSVLNYENACVTLTAL